jgi:uncharacterized protein (TIGR02284 family)
MQTGSALSGGPALAAPVPNREGALTMQTDSTISTVNDLIETCKDGEEGFRTAAEALQNPRTKERFQQYSRQRAEMARELQLEVRRLGGTPERSGSVSGSLHRGWMNIKSVVTGKDDQKIISEAERGEDVAKEVYAKALGQNLDARTRALVEQQAAQVRQVHDEVRAMEKSGAVK